MAWPRTSRPGAPPGMTDEMFGELMAVVGLANEANRLVSGYQKEIDEQVQGRLGVSFRPTNGRL